VDHVDAETFGATIMGIVNGIGFPCNTLEPGAISGGFVAGSPSFGFGSEPYFVLFFNLFGARAIGEMVGGTVTGGNKTA